MRGYTKEQLAAKAANVENYVLCDNCSLYWHKRVFKQHLNVGRETHRTIAVISPRHAEFLDFLAKAAVEAYMRDVAAGKVPMSEAQGEPVSDGDGAEVLTVDETVERHGLSRDELMAQFDDLWVPFEAFIPAPSRRSRKSR